MKAALLVILIGIGCTFSYAADDNRIELNSRKLKLTFSAKDGSLTGMVKSGHIILDNADATALWEINILNRQKQKFKISSLDLKRFEANRVSDDRLELIW